MLSCEDQTAWAKLSKYAKLKALDPFDKDKGSNNNAQVTVNNHEIIFDNQEGGEGATGDTAA